MKVRTVLDLLLQAEIEGRPETASDITELRLKIKGGGSLSSEEQELLAALEVTMDTISTAISRVLHPVREQLRVLLANVEEKIRQREISSRIDALTLLMELRGAPGGRKLDGAFSTALLPTLKDADLAAIDADLSQLLEQLCGRVQGAFGKNQ